MPKKILIIEDEKPLARALELKFTHEGFETALMNNGEGLEEVLREDQYSLILTDLVMPRVDGFEVLEVVQGKGIPVIVLTNLSQEEDEQSARALGVKDFFIKSSTPLSQVIDHVKKMLNVSSWSSEPSIKRMAALEGDPIVDTPPAEWEPWASPEPEQKPDDKKSRKEKRKEAKESNS